jgi:hypothetical protein
LKKYYFDIDKIEEKERGRERISHGTIVRSSHSLLSLWKPVLELSISLVAIVGVSC